MSVSANAKPSVCNFLLTQLADLNNALPPQHNLSSGPNFVIENKTRNNAFSVEGLARVLKDQDQYFEKLHQSSKELEDQIGRYSLHRELLEGAKKANFDSGFIEFLEKREVKGAAELTEFMEESRWYRGQNSRAQSLIESLYKVDLSSDTKEIKSFLKAVSKFFKRMRNKIEGLDALILKDEYDYQALEGGLHEFRRVLRWVPIVLQATKPLFYVQNTMGVQAVLYKDLIEKYGSSPYSKLGQKERGSVAIPQIPFYQLNYLIEELGKIKTQGESVFYLAKIYRKYLALEKGQEISNSEARKIVSAQLGLTDEDSIEQRSHALFQFYQKEDPIKAIASSLID